MAKNLKKAQAGVTVKAPVYKKGPMGKIKADLGSIDGKKELPFI